jgi:hypothetical protein
MLLKISEVRGKFLDHLTAKWECAGEQADTPLNARATPSTQSSNGRGEDEWSRAPRREDGKRDDYDEEEDNMTEGADDLKRRQDFPGKKIAQQRKNENRPCEQSSMPELWDVVGIVLDDEALNDGAFEERNLSACGNPRKDLGLLHNCPNGRHDRTVYRYPS